MSTVPTPENDSPRPGKPPARKPRRTDETTEGGTKKSQEPPASGTLAGEREIERSQADRDNPSELRETTEPEL